MAYAVSRHIFPPCLPHGRVPRGAGSPRGPIIRRFISSYESFLCPDIVIRGEFARENERNNRAAALPAFQIRVLRVKQRRR